ncbi:MAG: dienelactone hydrolase family protein [Chloroflexi bacterium]|nr:dienelactone hydrolase family protein [Chloroflexota bacterium]MBU1749999.1 dienelactone hydrolase family protein [Chloroflexota bacterium]MBU1878006.1 dienelactone hydrolase family protein [Chloroflexota bacterium]
MIKLVDFTLLMTMLALFVSGCSTPVDTPTPTAPVLPTATIAPTNTPVPTPTPTPQQVRAGKVNFVAEDGVKLAGTVFIGEGEKDIGVVLAHMGAHGANQSSWTSFAKYIAQRGFGALAFDFRAEESLLDRDVRAAVGFMHDMGYKRIVCMGASMGGTASLVVATDTELAGVVVISSPRVTGGGLSVSREDVARLAIPKLFVTTENDEYTGIAAAVKDLYRISLEPKQLQVFPGTAHGTDIFFTAQGDEFRDLLVSFLEELG